MKARVFRDKKGKAIASILESSEDPNLVPLDAETEDEGDVAEVEFRQRDLIDLERLHKRMEKGTDK